jgi:hypothetical protein
MSIFQTPMSEMLYFKEWREILDARKRVIFKRHLAKNDIPFRYDMKTADLQALYFMSKGYSVQRFNEERQKYRKWEWTLFYSYLNPQIVKEYFGH